MADYALQFDGSQNYLACGQLGTLGADLTNGGYWKFKIKTTSTTLGEFGGTHSNQTSGFGLQLNAQGINNQVSGYLTVYLNDASNNAIQGYTSSSSGFNDGNIHTVEIIISISAKTIVINVDGVSQSITYTKQQTLTNFVNFNFSWDIGARYYNGGVGNFFACIVDDVLIGYDSSHIYGNFQMDEGTGTTTANTGSVGGSATLTGSPLPSWVGGLGPITSIPNKIVNINQTIYRASRW